MKIVFGLIIIAALLAVELPALSFSLIAFGFLGIMISVFLLFLGAFVPALVQLLATFLIIVLVLRGNFSIHRTGKEPVASFLAIIFILVLLIFSFTALKNFPDLNLAYVKTGLPMPFELLISAAVVLTAVIGSQAIKRKGPEDK